MAGPVLGQPDAGGVPVAAAVAKSPGPAPARAFLPDNWLRGYVDFEFAPPTNEPDLDRCASYAGKYGANAPCTAFARYMLSGYVEARPFARTALRRVFLFATPRFSFGDNLPQVSYTADATPIAAEGSAGVGIELSDKFEIRVLRHEVYWFGRYRNYLGPADLGPSGPYGDYATVGARWYFGGYRRAPRM
jgi:hypothetical protein